MKKFGNGIGYLVKNMLRNYAKKEDSLAVNGILMRSLSKSMARLITSGEPSIRMALYWIF